MDLSSQLATDASGIHQVHYGIAPRGVARRNLPLLQLSRDFGLLLQKNAVRNEEENTYFKAVSKVSDWISPSRITLVSV